MKKNIAILAGGDSSEWVISLKSAEQVKNVLDDQLYNKFMIVIRGTEWILKDDLGDIKINKDDFSVIKNGAKINFDCAFIIIHGTPGENGLLQSYFELLRIPYTTCDVLVSALTFNKLACKAFVKEFGVLTAKAIILRKGDEVNISKIINYLGLPCFVKPNNGGSSFGASKVKLTEELLPAIENALKEDNEVIIEEFIKATELTCGVFKTRKNQYVFPITEVVSKNEFFDYEAKYTPGKSEEITPARISTEMEQRCKALSSSIYDILKCNGIVRIDYLLRENDLYFMEINTVPGMSQQSIIPQQVRVLGLELHEIFNELIDDSIERMKIR